jgi:PAS domain S-box-containing protein
MMADPQSLPLEPEFRALADCTPLLMWAADEQLQGVFFNRAWLEFSGRALGSQVGEGWWEGVHADDRAALRDARLGAWQRREPYSAEFRLRHRDGEYRWLQDCGAPRFTAEGEFRGFLGTCTDITDRRTSFELESRLAAIVEGSNDAIISKSLDGIIRTWNEGAERLFGYTAQEAVGRSIHLIIPPELRDEETRILERLRRGERIEHFETVRVRRDGRRINISLTISPVRDDHGRVIGASKVARDVTERRRMEQALRDSELRFASFMQHLPGLAWIKDAEGRYVFANEAAQKAFGVSLTQLYGRTDLDLFPAATAVQFRQNDRLALASENGVLIVEGLDDPQGNRHQSLVSKFPIPGADTSGVMIGGVAIDITERQQLERYLRILLETSESLSTLMDVESTLQRIAGFAVPTVGDWCAIDLLDSSHQLRRAAIAHVDPAQQAAADELSRRYPTRMDDVHGPARVVRTGESQLISPVDQSLLRQAARDPEHLALLLQLNLRSVICVPLRYRDRILGTMSLATADTGRHYTEADLEIAEGLADRAAVAIENARLLEQLKDADRRKDEFLAMLGHELRNPLASLRSGIDVLALDAQDGDVTIALMREHVLHLARLVDDLLDVSRITRGRIELQLRPLAVGDVLQQAVEAVRPALEERQHRLTVDLPREPLQLAADRVRLAQVFENLLHNSIKYTDPGGHITVTAQRERSEAVIAIRDNGIGIDGDLLPHVFDLFTQASRSLDRAQGGLGIGLTLVRRIIEGHHGSIEAISEGAGRGTTMLVRLPLTEAMPPEVVKLLPTAMAVGLKVLIVDDNVPAATLLARLLARLLTCTVDVVHDGPAALKYLDQQVPHAVLLDIGLPGLDGYEVARRIRQLPIGRKLLLVALTGYGQEDDRRRTREAGFDHHFVKPVDTTELLQVLTRLYVTSVGSGPLPGSADV